MHFTLAVQVAAALVSVLTATEILVIVMYVLSLCYHLLLIVIP
jgi:hypothetical protein